MINQTLAIILFLLTTCDGFAGPPANRLPRLQRQKLVDTARFALERKGLTLPRIYEVEVSDGQVVTELTPVRQLYVVTFKFLYRGKKDSMYTVHINKRSGKVEDVYNSRSSVPSRIFDGR